MGYVPSDFSDAVLIEVTIKDGAFLARFFWDAKDTRAYDGEGTGRTIDEAISAAVEDAQED